MLKCIERKVSLMQNKTNTTKNSIPVKPLHNHNIVSVHFNHFLCMKICDTQETFMYANLHISQFGWVWICIFYAIAKVLMLQMSLNYSVIPANVDRFRVQTCCSCWSCWSDLVPLSHLNSIHVLLANDYRSPRNKSNLTDSMFSFISDHEWMMSWMDDTWFNVDHDWTRLASVWIMNGSC